MYRWPFSYPRGQPQSPVSSSCSERTPYQGAAAIHARLLLWESRALFYLCFLLSLSLSPRHTLSKRACLVQRETE